MGIYRNYINLRRLFTFIPSNISFMTLILLSLYFIFANWNRLMYAEVTALIGINRIITARPARQEGL